MVKQDPETVVYHFPELLRGMYVIPVLCKCESKV